MLYYKIEGLYKRDMEGNKKLIIGEFRKLLGFLGFKKFCKYCGRKKQVELITLAADEEVFKNVLAGVKFVTWAYKCPHCDHLDRFDTKGLNEHIKS